MIPSGASEIRQPGVAEWLPLPADVLGTAPRLVRALDNDTPEARHHALTTDVRHGLRASGGAFEGAVTLTQEGSHRNINRLSQHTTRCQGRPDAHHTPEGSLMLRSSAGFATCLM